MTRVLSIALAAALTVVPAADAKKKHPKPPSAKAIDALMQENYIGDDATNYPTTTYKLTVDHIQRGGSRLGSYRHDGVPPHTKTIVFPTQVTMTYTVCYPDGEGARQQKIVAKDVFFKDDFGAWTFREYSEKRTPPTGSDTLASCPL